MRLPTTLFGVILASVALNGCGPAPLQEMRLPSGRTVGVLSETAMHFSNEPAALVFKYQTHVPLSDKTQLRAEAAEVWEKVRPEAEKGNFTSALLGANDPPKGLIITSNSSYTYMLKRDADGVWNWSPEKK